MADMAEHHEIGILFCVSCGPRLSHRRLPGRPWRVEWSVEGGSTQEGVCALVHDTASTAGVRSVHHNLLSVLLPPAGTPQGTRTLVDALLTGCYAVGTPARETADVADRRWPATMGALAGLLRRHAGPKITLGDFNALDPAVLLDEEQQGADGTRVFAELLDVLNQNVAPVAVELPTARRIDHIILDGGAEGFDVVAEIAWCLRWCVDHALVWTDLHRGENSLPEPSVWRSVNYNTQDPDALLEFTQAATLFARHHTVDDPPSRFDEALRRASIAALSRNRVCRSSTRVPSGADGQIGNAVIEWLAARAAGLAAEHLEVDDTHMLAPTADAQADARRAYDVFRELRSRAREDVGERRRARAAKRKEWEAECVASERGVTQRLLRKPGPTMIAIVEDADGTTATGAALPQAVWEQSRGMREDAQLRAETAAYLRKFEGDRVGPPLDLRTASSLLWGLNSSAPGVDQISARMLRHLEAWAPDIWRMWVAMQNKWRRDLAAQVYEEVLIGEVLRGRPPRRYDAWPARGRGLPQSPKHRRAPPAERAARRRAPRAGRAAPSILSSLHSARWWILKGKRPARGACGVTLRGASTRKGRGGRRGHAGSRNRDDRTAR
eukprot:gene12806-1130_t